MGNNITSNSVQGSGNDSDTLSNAVEVFKKTGVDFLRRQVSIMLHEIVMTLGQIVSKFHQNKGNISQKSNRLQWQNTHFLLKSKAQ